MKEDRIKNLRSEFVVERVASGTSLLKITRYRHFGIKTARINILKNSTGEKDFALELVVLL